MLRTTLAMLLISIVAFGQTKDVQRREGKTPEIDKAAAYYHFMLARLYADEALSFSLSHKAEYTELARKELKAALKADPDAPVIELPDVPRSGGRRHEGRCRCVPWEPSDSGNGLRRSTK
jgi:hypothetical protein